jgi:hypothetical protein
VSFVRAPANISIATKAQGDTCTSARWFGCDSATDNGSHTASCLVNPMTADRILYAEYFPSAVYPLTFPPTSVNGTVTCSATSVCDGTAATCSFAPSTNYHIDSISIDGSPITISSPKGLTYTFNNITSAHSVDATFVIDTFSVSASAGNNGIISPSGITSINYGSNLSYAITPEINYHIVDVQIDGISAGPITNYSFSNITAPHTISASFAINTFTITASADNFGTISPAGSTVVNYALNLNYIITPATGYHVIDVFVDGVSVGPVTSYTFSAVKAPHTISASFAIDTFAITASATGNGAISPSGATTVNYGLNQSYTISPATGYHVADVLVDGGSVGPVTSYTFSTVKASHAISATFEIDTFPITASVSGNGTISPTGSTSINYDLNQSYTITPATGHHVTDVLVDGISVGPVTSYTFYNVKLPHTIAASCNIDTFVVTVKSVINGMITPSDATPITYGQDRTYTITPDATYRITDVQVDERSVGPVTSYTFSNITAAHSISASFATNIFTVTPSAGSGGTITPNTIQSVSYNGSVQFDITPAAGYIISDVLIDGISKGAPTSYLFSSTNSSHTIEARFTDITAPDVILTSSITADLPTSQNTADFGFTSADPAATFVCSHNNSTFATCVSPVSYNGLSDGIHTFSVKSTDPSGNISQPQTISWLVDTTPPQELACTPDPGSNMAQFACQPAIDSTQFTTNVSGIASYLLSYGETGTALPQKCTNGAAFDPYFDLVFGLTNGTAYDFRLCAVDNAGNVSTGSVITMTPQETFITLSPSSNNFGAQAINTNSAPFTALLKNSHTYEVTINNISLLGANAGNFRITSGGSCTATPFTLSPSAQCTINVEFKPISAASGVSRASLNIEAEYGSSNVAPILLNGLATFDINASAGSNGVISPVGITTVNDGASQSYTITPAAGYHVADVLIDGSSIGAVTSYTFKNVAASRTISATFAIDMFAITATTDGSGTISPSGSTLVSPGSSLSYTIAASTGSHISSVLVDGVSFGAVANYTFSNISASPHTIKATFATDTFPISASVTGPGTTIPAGTTAVAYGSDRSYTIISDSGYHVTKVLVDNLDVGPVTSYTFSSVTAPHSLTVTFDINTFDISASANSGGSITPTTSVNYQGNKTFTITPDTGNHIVDVLVDGTSVGATNSYTFTSVTSPHHIGAVFAIDTFTITSSAGIHGTISPAGATKVTYGSNQSYTITPETGYHLTSVLIDGVISTNYTFSAITASHTISATFAIDTLNITSSAEAHGTISPAGSTVLAPGSSQVYSITPDPGYNVTGVLVDNVSVGAVTNYTFNTVNASHAISATFAIKSFTISSTASTGGTITPTVSVNYQDNKTFTITPATGYHISDVQVDGISVGATNSYTFTSVTTPHSITASFASDSFTITSSADPHGTISPAGAANSNYGASRSYSITPDTGYHIASVLVDGANAGAISNYTFNAVTAAHTITATFAIDTVTITASTTPGGSVTSSSPVPYGSPQNIVLTPSIGYHLTELTDNGTNVLAAVTNKALYTIAAVTAPHTIHATFAPYTLADALLALRAAIGMSLAKPEEMIWLDVAPLDLGKPKGDGAITIQDAYILLRRQIGLYSF